MNADDKIEEAKFFLKKLEQYESTFLLNEYYLNAFISSTDSISEYLLEDYQRAFRFDIRLNERDFKGKFEEKAIERAKNNDDKPLKFFEWYKNKIKLIESDDVGKILSNRRNVVIHREPERPTIKVLTRDSSKPSSSFFSEPDIIISRLPHITMIEACKKFLILMENLVSEAHKNFPHELFDVNFSTPETEQ